MARNSWLDKIANSLGYIKSVALHPIQAIGAIAYPSSKTADELSAFVSWVFACVKARSRDTAQIKLRLYKKNGDEVEEVLEHDILSLLRSVNPFMTWSQLIEYTQSYKDLTGEAFWFLQRAGGSNTGMITQIWLLRPDWVNIETSQEGFIKGYTYKVPGAAPITFELDQVIHHKDFNPINPYRGLGVVRAAAVTIDSEVYAEEYNKNFFRNSALPDVVLTTEQKLTDDIIKRVQTQWQNKYGGAKNAHKTAVLEGGLEAKPLMVSQREMEFLSGLGFSRDKILAMFEVPKSRLGMTEGVTVSNAEATINIYLKYLIKRLMEQIRDTLNERMLPLYKGTEDMFFEIDDPVPADVAAEMTRLQSMFAMGAVTPNEVREELGYNEETGLDNFYVPFNLTTVAGEDEPDPQQEPGKGIVVPQKGKRGKRITVKAPAMRLKERVRRQLAEEIMDGITKSIARSMPAFARSKHVDATEFERSNWSEEKRAAFWKQMVGKSEVFEKRYEEALVKFFERQQDETLARLNSVEGKSVEKFSRAEIESILISVSAENKIAAELLLPIVRQILEESGNDTLEALTDDDVTFDASTEAVKEFMRTDAMKGIRLMNKVTKSKLRRQLSDALADGLGPIETARKIREVFTEAKSVRSLRVARTESLKAANRGTLEAYKQSGVVLAKEWLTAEDEGVCPFCGPMNGKIVSVGSNFFEQGETYMGLDGKEIKFNLENVPTPPLHPNCRCTIVPVTINQRAVHKPEEKAGDRATISTNEEGHE